MTDRRGLLLIVLAAALWGTTGTAQALGPAGSDPIAVGVARLLVAAPALLLIARADEGALEPVQSDWPPVVMAGVAMAAYQPLFFTAVAETGVALGTVVTIGSAPLMTGVLTRLFDDEIPSRRWWPATALGVAGVALIALSADDVGVEAGGVLLALGAGLSFAIYIVASRRVVEAVSPISATSRIFAVAAVLSLPLLLWADFSWISTPGGWSWQPISDSSLRLWPMFCSHSGSRSREPRQQPQPPWPSPWSRPCSASFCSTRHRGWEGGRESSSSSPA